MDHVGIGQNHKLVLLQAEEKQFKGGEPVDGEQFQAASANPQFRLRVLATDHLFITQEQFKVNIMFLHFFHIQHKVLLGLGDDDGSLISCD